MEREEERVEGIEDVAESRSSGEGIGIPFAKGFCCFCLTELVDRIWSEDGTVSRLLIGKAMATGDLGLSPA
jgi:hypothetical protein